MAKKPVQTPLTTAMEAGLSETVESFFQDFFYNRKSRAEFIEAIDELLRRQAFLELLAADKGETLTKLSERWLELTAVGNDGEALVLIATLLQEVSSEEAKESATFSGLETLHGNFLSYQATDRYAQELAALFLTL